MTTPEHTQDGATIAPETTAAAYAPPGDPRFQPDGEAYTEGGAEFRAGQTQAVEVPQPTFDEDGRRTDQPDIDDPEAVRAFDANTLSDEEWAAKYPAESRPPLGTSELPFRSPMNGAEEE